MTRRRVKRRRRLTAAELRAIQSTPGLIVQRFRPGERGRLEEIVAEGVGKPRFDLGLTADTQASMART